jgi:type VI secretion system secreted protein Hcp
MAVDAFIWFESPGSGQAPVGETQDARYSQKNAFEIKDFNFGIENPTTVGSAAKGAGAGKIKFNEFVIKKTTDLASPCFFKNSCIGAHYANVIIEMRKAGGTATASGKPYLRFKFGTVFTTKISWNGPGEEAPEEEITFVYGQFGVCYVQQDEKGQSAAQPWEGWDQVKNIDAKAWMDPPS